MNAIRTMKAKKKVNNYKDILILLAASNLTNVCFIVAKALRDGAAGNSSLIPFLVDFENDTMCFLHISSPNVKDESKHSIMFSSSNFRLPLLRPLKVDSSVYRLADDSNSILPDDWQLSVAYRQEAFGSDQFSECYPCKDFIREEFSKVDSRGPIREEFFWTSSVAHTYFSSHGTGENDDEFWNDYTRFKDINRALAPLFTSDFGTCALVLFCHRKVSFHKVFSHR
jgi:hypothetical protein